MDNKIVTARFATDDNYVNVYDVYQWDYGQVLRIEGLKLPNMVEIHFSLQETSGEAKTRIGVTKDGVTDVVIPDSFLENEGIGDNYKIFVWVYVADKDSGSTEYKITIHIKARAKPEITHGGQDGEMFQEAVEAVRDAAKRAAESEKQAERWAVGRADIPGSETDNSKFYSEESKKNAQQTTKDKEAVEELVKKTENIGQLAEDVKANAQKASESAKNAETSATNASVSEKNAKTSESNASTSETNAKASETNAKASEQAVEKSKQTVDKAITDFGQAVTDASAVLKSEKDAHVKAITTAGTTETRKVTDEGTKQVQAVQSMGTQETEKVTAEGTKQVGLVKTEGEKYLASVQQAAQEIIADREQIAKNKTDIADLRQKKADAIVNAVSGTLLNIKDSAEAFAENLIVHGKTEQIQTTGKNLLDIDTAVPKGWNLDITNLSHLIEGETYTMSVVSLNDASCGIVLDDREMLVAYLNPGQSTSFAMPDKSTFSKMSLAGGTATALLKDKSKVKIQIEKGSVATSYEPYTGGKPSPRPDCKQDILNVGQINEDTGKYEVQVKVTGKNLIPFPYPNIKEIGKTVNFKGVDYTVLQDGGVHLKGTPQDGFGLSICANPFKECGTIKVSDLIYYDPNNNITFFYLFEYVGKAIDMVVYPQVEVGTVATTYEPYKEPQTITLQLDRPLTKWDRLEKRDGVWGIVRNSEIKELTDKDKINEYVPGSGKYEEGLHCYNIWLSKSELEYSASYCTHFKNVDYAFYPEKGENGIYSDHAGVTMKYFISDKPTVEEFKAWLTQQKEAGTPVELVYKTAEETWEPLPEETQLALNALHTNYPTTVVANSEDTEMQLTYVADTKNYIDKKFEELNQAIVNTQIALL